MKTNVSSIYNGVIDDTSLNLRQIRLAELEKGAVNDMFVILSDVWLDDDKVLAASVLSDCSLSLFLSHEYGLLSASFSYS